MKISNYFNPFYDVRAFDKFHKLTDVQKIKTVALTAIATLASLPLLGLGGMVAFRWAAHHFTVVKFDLKAATPLEGEDKTAHERFMSWLNARSDATVVSSGQKVPLKYERDTLFNIIGQTLGKTGQEVIADLKKYVAEHPKKVESLLKRLPLSVQKDLKTYICSEFAVRDLTLNGRNAYLGFFQLYLNKARFELFSEIYSLNIQALEISTPYVPDNSSYLNSYQMSFGDDSMFNSIAIVHGSVERGFEDKYGLFRRKTDYLQPRLLEPKV